MSLTTTTAKRDTLRGNQKAPAISEKVLYPTVDSLALKRARLPLQLHDGGTDIETQEETENERKALINGIDRESGRTSLTVKSRKSRSPCRKYVTKFEMMVEQRNDSLTGAESVEMTLSDNERNDDSSIQNGMQEPSKGETKKENDNNDNKGDDIMLVKIETIESNNVKSVEIHWDSKLPADDNARTDVASEENEFTDRKSSDVYDDCTSRYVVRRCSNSSDDYEKVDVRPYREVLDVVNDESFHRGRKIAGRSKSTNDLLSRSLIHDRGSLSLSSDDEERDNDLCNNNNNNKKAKKKKKKRHFARNVLHYVPGYLGKRYSKQPAKKKKKKKYNLTASLSSMRSLGEEDEMSIDETREFSRSRSLSRFELKYVKISPPSNFVHVASATNPSLVSNENTVKSRLEQPVIIHEEKFANLPLLPRREQDEYDANGTVLEDVENAKCVGKSIGRTCSPVSTSLQRINEEAPTENIRRENVRTAYVEIKQTSAIEECTAKVLDHRQTVKTETESQSDFDEETISYEPILRTNTSFLWSDRTRNLLDSKNGEARLSSPIRSNEETLEEQPYDDVGPSKPFSQEDYYDDVGPPLTAIEGNTLNASTLETPDDTYDDVLVPISSQTTSSSNTVDENTYISICTGTTGSREEQDDDGTLFEENVNNDYSSIEDDEFGAEDGDDERDIYDDVGFPAEERVNSLYGDSIPASLLGSVAMNGKESEWEDIDDSTNALSCLCQDDCACGKVEEREKRRGVGQRSGKKGKGRRSRRCRKSPASSTRTTHDSTVHESASEDSTYESLRSCQPDDFSTDSETEATVANGTTDCNANERYHQNSNSNIYLEAPARPIPPPPRESSLTQTLGRRIKMLRRTWSITKGSLGRIRRRTFVDEEHSCEESKEFANEQHQQQQQQQNHHHNHNHQVSDTGKYFSFRKHFRKNLTSFSTFYLNDSNDICTARNNNNSSNKEVIYGNTNWYTWYSPMKNEEESSSQRALKIDVDHYSVLADQEPLYQFYAAAAARVAFESDSDGYEEVEDLSPTPVATDFAKPGQRTLWCQTPQVVRSGLLQRLTPEEKKIQEAKFEILTSETSYLNSLRVLDNEFLNNYELMNEILTPTEKNKLFAGVPGIIQASERLLADLETIWKEDPMLHNLPEVLLKHSEKYLDIFVGYCSNQVKIDMTLKDLRARKGSKFLEIISQIETRPTCQSLPLLSFLMLPMQRITRLPLLADAVLSKLPMENADRSSWEKVLSTFSYVASECNEGARAAAQEAEMEMIARKLEYSSKIKPLVLKNRYLIKKGSVIHLTMKAEMEYKLTFGKKFNKTPLYLFLLTDYLLVTKVKHNTHDEAYTVIDVCKRNLLALESVPEDSPFAGRNAMLLTLLENYCTKQVEYILTCESNTERERWIEAISPPKRDIVGETLYESWDCPQVMALYSYSANQPDELSLQPGDVINVLRKMADGWYNGEKLLNGEQGWFPANYTKEVASEHVRARNLKQRHRLLALTGSVLQRRAKQNLAIH